MKRFAIVLAALVAGVGAGLALWLPTRPASAPTAPGPFDRARVLLAKDNLEGAADAIREGLKAADSAEGNALLGFVQYRKGDLEGARSLLDRAAQMDPAYAMTYLYRGQVHMTLADWRAAHADFDEVVRLQPERAEGHALRADARFHQDELAGAVEDAVAAIKLDPDCAEAYFARGAAYAALGREDEALRDYSKCVALKPRHVGARVNRGNLHARRGALASAIADWEGAIEIEPALRSKLEDLIREARGR